MTLTISLPPDAESKLRDRAHAAGQDLSQYVEQLVVREIAESSSLPEPARPATDPLDDRYQQGYLTHPEEITDTVALLPHLGVEAEEWQ